MVSYMHLTKFRRLARRIGQDFKIFRLTKNWKEILIAKTKHDSYRRISFRNGMVLESPSEVSLDFLFHEIWLDEFYSGEGYEIQPNDTIVDIGGNIGVFALWAATRAKNVLVHSFEPFPKNAEYFAANQKVSGVANINFHTVAVADADGFRTLQLAESWMLHSLGEKQSGSEGIEVQCVSFDSVVADIPVCHFLKLDCEGGEYEILYGASDESLSKVRRLICEFNIRDSKKRNGNALAQFLTEKDFVIDDLQMLQEGCGVIRARQR